ncbi:MAG: 50S ribosomal protein L9 [Patescibacteria group bacterium]
MKVLLLKSISGSGQKGDIISVSEGYARNFLFPRALALPAESSEGKKLLQNIKNQKAVRARQLEDAGKWLKKLQGKIFEFDRAANSEGRLYEGVSKEDILCAINSTSDSFFLKNEQIKLSAPIKKVGAHKVFLIEGDNGANISIQINPKK